MLLIVTVVGRVLFYHVVTLYSVSSSVQVLCAVATEGEVGGAWRVWSERQGEPEPGDPKEPPAAAGESAAKNWSGQVWYYNNCPLGFGDFSVDSFLSPHRLTQTHSQHSEKNEALQQRMNELKSSLGSAQLEASRWMARYDSLMEQHQGLDITMTKLDNHCEVNQLNQHWFDLHTVKFRLFSPFEEGLRSSTRPWIVNQSTVTHNSFDSCVSQIVNQTYCPALWSDNGD